MLERISDETLNDIITANDLVEVAAEYLNLEVTENDLRASCPFHEGDLPSFFIDPQAQTFYCPGCRNGGNVIHFVMDMEEMRFIDACRRLAERGGVTMHSDTDDEQSWSNHYGWMSSHFQDLLWNTKAGRRARNFLNEHSIEASTIQRWKVGLVPHDITKLVEKAERAGFDEEEIEKVMADRSCVENNEHRHLCFPHFDHRNRVNSFIRRCLSDSPDRSESFRNWAKARLYELNCCARDQIQSRGLWIVDDPIDVLSAHQHGLENVISTVGKYVSFPRIDRATILTEQDRVDYWVRKVFRTPFHLGVQIEIAVLPEGESVRTMLAEGKKNQVEELAETASEFINFKIQRLKERYDQSTVEGKMNGVRQVVSSIRGAKKDEVKARILRKIDHEFDVGMKDVQGILDSMETAYRPVRPSPRLLEPNHPVTNPQRSEKDRKIQQHIRRLLCSPEEIPEPTESEAEQIEFPDGYYRMLYDTLLEHADERGGEVEVSSLLSSLEGTVAKAYLLELLRLQEEEDADQK